MVYFVVNITYNEIVQLQKNLAAHTFCLFESASGDNRYYGAVEEIGYHTLLHTLNAETLENLEYLNEEEFSLIAAGVGNIKCIGNSRVIAKYTNA